MGIKKFSQAFTARGTMTLKNLAGLTLGIDAMTELYSAALGMKTVTALTDRYGKPTIHINCLLAKIIEFHLCGINQVWVFDHDGDAAQNEQFHNPAKMAELAKRNARRAAAREKLKEVREQTGQLFSDSDEEETARASQQAQQSSLEKQTFSVSREMINDVKLMLNCLNIRYVESPAGYEGEQVASILNAAGVLDGVYSGDTDPIAFGATNLYRKNRVDKKIYHYSQEDIFEQIAKHTKLKKVNIDDLLRIAVMLGTDFAAKTPRVGPKTVFKWMGLALTSDQKQAILQFKKSLDPTTVVIKNADRTPFIDCAYQDLTDWLVAERSFSLKKVKSWLDKAVGRAVEDMPVASKVRCTTVKKKTTRSRKKKPTPILDSDNSDNESSHE